MDEIKVVEVVQNPPVIENLTISPDVRATLAINLIA